jgi:hypothetical protein
LYGWRFVAHFIRRCSIDIATAMLIYKRLPNCDVIKCI